MNHSARIAVYLFAAACLLLAPAAHAARKAKEILQYIPAETPYVFAMTEPYPEELQEKFEPLLDETLAAYRQVMRLKLDESRAEMASAEGGAENAARMEADERGRNSGSRYWERLPVRLLWRRLIAGHASRSDGHAAPRGDHQEA